MQTCWLSGGRRLGSVGGKRNRIAQATRLCQRGTRAGPRLLPTRALLFGFGVAKCAPSPPPPHDHPVTLKGLVEGTATAARRPDSSALASGLLRRREELKDELRGLVEGTTVGKNASSDARQQVDAICESLAADSPTRRPTSGPRLSGRWRLVYTTEKDVHALCALPTREISQEIDLKEKLVTNRVLYELPLGLVATAPCTVSGPSRIEYAFDNFVLSVGPFDLSIAPRGKGWSETVFLDDEMRIVRNSRGDLLVLERE